MVLVPVAVPERLRYLFLHNHLEVVLDRALRGRTDVVIAGYKYPCMPRRKSNKTNLTTRAKRGPTLKPGRRPGPRLALSQIMGPATEIVTSRKLQAERASQREGDVSCCSPMPLGPPSPCEQALNGRYGNDL